ncbi:MAG: sulfate adenylyltransferase [Crocinitomicaceae bacterium]|nr:sulfate adenylyltransferase [Crocinitomicaceae bacterium]
MELVRISTAGSVDDGKSTLIGRLLYDNNALTVEQEELVAKKTKEKGWDDLDLSVITDGLMAEREQGITIDVANMYFSTKTRKFIITDSPGHVEYTRNMVTGASTAETSIILVDARKGLLEQSYRHFYISQLLRLENVIFCVNKMDLVDYSEDTFLEIGIQIKGMVEALDADIQYSIVPVSSLKGDNVVNSSNNTPWYSGPTLNDILHKEKVAVTERTPFRFDVQQVNHSQEKGFVDFRGLAGRVISGSVRVGDRIVALPSKKESVVTEVRRYTESLDSAKQGDSITISLADEIDVSRGVVFSSLDTIPNEDTSISCTVVWMDEKEGRAGAKYLLKTGSREFAVKIQAIHTKVDPTQANAKFDVDTIEINDLTNIDLKLSQPSYLDAYSENKSNGVFILIDPQSNNTVAVGFVNK